MTCTYLIRKNRANHLGPRVECGGDAVVVYHSPWPDAYGATTFPRCTRHDTQSARDYAAQNGWRVVELGDTNTHTLGA